MGRDHAGIIAEQLPGAELRVISDVSKAAARDAADMYGVQHTCVDGIEAINRPDVDAVLIASPDPTHAELTLAAIKQHKPVLCEKPLAVNSAECMTLIEAECETGRQLVQLGFMRRFDPAYRDMKSLILSGRIGQAIMMHNFHRNVQAPPGFSGLMAITNSAPHEFDAVRYVLDDEVVSVSAFEPMVDSKGACKPVVLVMHTAQGRLCTVEVNNNADYGYDVRAELVGTVGAVSIKNPATISIDSALSSSVEYAKDWRPRFADAYRLQDKAWIDSVVSGKPAAFAANAWDGYCATAIAEAGSAALSSGQHQSVDLIERPALYRLKGDTA